MPLVKRARLTSRKIRANRRNGRKSQGPNPKSRIAAMMRALEGLDDAVCPPSLRTTLVGLRENPFEFACHHQELIDEWQPSTPTQRKLVLRLAYLMWRQQRAERAQDGVAVCRIEKELAARTQRSVGSAGVPWLTFDEMPDQGGLRQLPPSHAKFEQLLEGLQFLIGRLDAGDFSPDWEITLQQIYGSKPTQRSAVITEWARELAQYDAQSTPDDSSQGGEEGSDGGEEGDEGEEWETWEGWESPVESIRSEASHAQVLHSLRRGLAEEHRNVAIEYRLYKATELDFPSHLADSLCAPQDKYAGTAIRQEQALARDIERTLRLLVTLKEREGSPDSASGRAASPRRPRRGRVIRRRASGGRK